MIRTASTAIALVLLSTAAAFAQVPPGQPYDPEQHPNPILTYVSPDDFAPTTYTEARNAANLEILGLSQEVGRREALELARPAAAPRQVRILGRNADVVFYPVVRQTFTLNTGDRLLLHSFRFPRVSPTFAASLGFPLADALDETAFGRTGRTDARFGLAPAPERTSIRGVPALLFEGEDGAERTISWVEDGVVHTVTSAAPQSDLLLALRDLL